MIKPSSSQSVRVPARHSGFTLIELMITLVVVAILAAVAIPSYSSYTLRNTRVAAQTYMALLAGKQEQYLLDSRQYASAVSLLSLDLPSHLSGKYTVTMTAVNSATPPSFVVTATPAGSQASDTKCAILTLSNTGAKTATGTGGVSACW